MSDMSEESMDLFAEPVSASSGADGAVRPFEPLARRMRPRNFQEFIGQWDTVGQGRFLRTAGGAVCQRRAGQGVWRPGLPRRDGLLFYAQGGLNSPRSIVENRNI